MIMMIVISLVATTLVLVERSAFAAHVRLYAAAVRRHRAAAARWRVHAVDAAVVGAAE